VFAATEREVLEGLATGKLRPSDTGFIRESNEADVLRFLEIRCKLLLRGYPTTPEQDEERLASGGLQGFESMALQQCLHEKKILSKTIGEITSLQAAAAAKSK